MILLSQLVVFLSALSTCHSWSQPNNSNSNSNSNNGAGWTRREALVANVATTAALFSSVVAAPSLARAATAPAASEKQIGISNEALAQVITSDIRDNQFMVRADLTRSVYDESATFTDEIDTYQLDPWIKGTKRLFIADKSLVELVPNSLKVTDREATFLFTEKLTFNIPFLLPKVYLTGQVVLKRDPSTGLITSYQEKWDQDVNTVVTSAQLFGGK
jgi:hypothetical protein